MNLQQIFSAGWIIKIRYSTYTHYAVVSDRIGEDGFPMVIDNSAAEGTVTERLWSEATAGRPVSLSQMVSDFSPREVLACAKSLIGQIPYSAINFNCESFVRKVLGLPSTSKQVVASAITVPTAMYAAHKVFNGNVWVTGLVGLLALGATTYAVAE